MGFMKKIVLMLMMAVAAISAHAQKYALIDMEYILKNVPEICRWHFTKAPYRLS